MTASFRGGDLRRKARPGYRTALLLSVGAVLLSGTLAAASSPATARDVVAICTTKSTVTFSAPLSDTATAETVSGTDVIDCFDAEGKALVSGTSAFSEAVSGAQCTGHEQHGPASVTVNWADGSLSKIVTRPRGQMEDGRESFAGEGSVSPDSTRFAGDTISMVGMTVTKGCHTPGGASKAFGFNVLTFSH
ncbi:hypothetical protein ACIGQE_21000 [Streptomyces sp. NPDC053429]|uniref:hypothetical protein n=1 Tax=Streptomyces sp. NPDC053429 TaxID=3365702 RepID=UPI0037D93CCE